MTSHPQPPSFVAAANPAAGRPAAKAGRSGSLQTEEEIVMANFVTLVSQLVSSDVFGTLVIDVPGGSKNGGTPVILFQEHDFNPGDNQLWELRLTGESDGSGHPFVFIINKNSGLAL